MTYIGSSSVVWEALGCLAGIDWTALFFWCLITFSLCLVSILLISIFLPVTIKDDEGLSAAEPGQPPQGLEVFQQLFSQKLLPIDASTGWHLIGVHHELRTWVKKVQLRGSSYHLHGSSAVISSSAKSLLETLKDITKTLEWDNEVTECNYISCPTNTDASDYPLMTDVVSMTLDQQKMHPDAFLDRLVAFLATPYNMLSKGSGYVADRNAPQPAVVSRSWKMEGDSSGWIFSRTVFKGKGHTLDDIWSYFLLQQTTEDPNKCVIHHITCIIPTGRRDCLLCEKPSSRLTALKQYFELKHLKVSPLCHSSLKHLTSHTLRSKPCTKAISSDKSLYSSLRDSLPDSVMPIYTPNGSDCQLTHGLNLSWPSDTRKPRSSSLGLWQDNNSSSDDAGFYSERQHRSRRQRVRKTVSADVAGGGGDRRRNSMERKTGSLDRTISEKGSGDLEDSGLVDNLAEYQSLADQGLNMVLEESIKAARINVNVSEEDQKQQTGGWSFHCLEKDVVILKKPKNGNYYSFLGKGIIKASPATVFKAIRNPRTRFTYDTMLKKMNIIKTLSEDMCVYHMVHEVPQLLKKESRDFCVLQVCKTVGDRHIVSSRSIEWIDCPEDEMLVRGQLLPSGWVIEPVGNQYSMVTYITQVALCGKDVPAAFSQFLSVRVPLSIAYLRLFLEAQLP